MERGAGEPQEDTESSLPRGDDLRHCRQTVDIMPQLFAHLCFLLHACCRRFPNDDVVGNAPSRTELDLLCVQS
uniref:(California timema) hypothetical protein n=1 Tax=Timema californicum TaxID=61474 RepID=A0A7R9IWK3_TIMCA|nr:unnamed protein product [Timema californicum]